MKFIFWLDRIVFRFVPGLCFWIKLWIIFAVQSEIYRLDHPVWTGILSLVSVFYIFTIIYWIFLGDTELAPQNSDTSSVKKKNFWRDFFVFGLNIGLLFWFFSPKSFFQFFILAGSVHFLGIFLADMIMVLRFEWKGFVEVWRAKNLVKLRSKFLLLCLVIFLYISPSIYFGIAIVQELGLEQGWLLGLVPVAISFANTFWQRLILTYQQETIHTV